MRAAKDQPNKILFRVAYARSRPFYCRGCICLTLDERNYQRRVFRMARAWSGVLKRDREQAEMGQG